MKTPVYNGYPLSLLVRLSLPESPVQFWQWGQTLHECWDEGSETTNMLATMGYERVAPAESKELYAYLMAQLCDVQYVNAAGFEEEKRNLQQLWAYAGDLEHVKQVPVILAFRLPEGLSPPPEQSIPMLSFLPPPQLGELALIKVDEKDYVYKIEELGESGAATWRATTLTPLAKPKKKRATKPRVPPPHPVVAKDPPVVHTRADIFTHYMQRGLLDVTKFIHYPDIGIAELRQAFSKEKGEMLITIKPGTDEGWATIGEALQTLEKRLGDEVSDTFLALLALAIETNGVENINVPFYINPDDILAMCQREKSNGSYTPPQRLAVIEHLRTLTWAHVRASFPLRRGREAFAESPILEVLGGRIGVMNTLTGEEIWEKRQVKIGDWAAMIPEISQQTAIMLRQVLKYHSHNQRYEKRLGRYLTLMFRVNAARKGGTFQCSMGVLLEQAGIIANLNKPGETHRMIDKALKRLQEDGVIGEYGQIEDASPKGQEVKARIEQQAYHWWDLYIHQQWCFWPPETVREVYARLLKQGS